MNTLVHGSISGKQNVVCKFAKWCDYKHGDVIDIGFDAKKIHFFELPVRDESGRELPGKTIL